jgi:tetratricopeptide (TPR) repeat protein
MVQALAMTARGHLIRDDMKTGLIWLQRAEQLAKDEEPLGWSRYLGVKGRFEWKKGDNPKATLTFYEMYDYCIEHELFSRAIDAAHMVAITGTPEEQVEWAYKGIKAAELGNEDGWLGPLWNNLGATYWDKAKSEGNDKELNEKALFCYLKARNYHWKMGSEKSKLIADWAVGSAYRRLGDFEKAGAWLRAVLAWSERLYSLDSKPGTGEWIGWCNYDLGLMSQEQGNNEAALPQLRIAREYLGKANMPKWDKKTWDLLEEQIVALENQLK